MGRTIMWMRDKIHNLDKESKLYYETFNNLYYNHKKPTEEHCKILNITMERALQIIKESNAIENRQRRDCQNYSHTQFTHCVVFGGNSKKRAFVAHDYNDDYEEYLR